MPRVSPLRSIHVPLAIFAIVIALLAVGLTGVYSASASLAGNEARRRARSTQPLVVDAQYHDTVYLKRQAMWAGMGLVALTFFFHFNYRRLKTWSFWIMIASFALCCLVFVPGIGHEAGGGRRWIRLGPLGRFQPSEMAKLGLIIYMAKMLDDRRQYIKSFFSGVAPALFVTAAFAFIIVIEPDFGGAFVLCAIIFGMWLCGEVRWFHLGGLAMASLPAMAFAFLLRPYRFRRLLAFFADTPEARMNEGYQLHQSLIAIGSGGPFGLGLGGSMQKHHYLFAGHTDFVFSILAEELGFYRMSVILALFTALVMLGFWVALNTSDLFGSLLATGITLMIFLGASINMGVVLGMLPTKGLVLPFVSYGGSALLVTMASVGILMNIAACQFGLVARGAKARSR